MEHDLNLMDLMERFSTPEKARANLEATRWPDGPVCPHCQSREAYRLTPKPTSKRPGRPGLLKCKDCRKQFTVTVGTIFEDSHIPLHKWLIAVHLICASKKGISTHQLHRMLGITYKCAWHMTRRIRYAMAMPPLKDKMSGTIEVDETYVGPKERGLGHGIPLLSKKTAVVALVQRGGKVRSFHMDRVTLNNIGPLLKEHVAPTAQLNTDDSPIYRNMKPWFPKHKTVVHSKHEYVRYEPKRTISTNTVEGFFSLVKRGVYGTYHHWSKEHMHRYLAEFDFRYNHREVEDGARAIATLQQIEGKRLTYKPLVGAKNA